MKEEWLHLLFESRPQIVRHMADADIKANYE
jgi:hypothetical protein